MQLLQVNITTFELGHKAEGCWEPLAHSILVYVIQTVLFSFLTCSLSFIISIHVWFYDNSPSVSIPCVIPFLHHMGAIVTTHCQAYHRTFCPLGHKAGFAYVHF